MSTIKNLNTVIKRKQNKREAIVVVAKALREFQHDLGTQDCIDARLLLASLDNTLMNQITQLKEKVNKLYEQPRC